MDSGRGVVCFLVTPAARWYQDCSSERFVRSGVSWVDCKSTFSRSRLLALERSLVSHLVQAEDHLSVASASTLQSGNYQRVGVRSPDFTGNLHSHFVAGWMSQAIDFKPCETYISSATLLFRCIR